MIDTSCHCGRVRVVVRRRPDFLHECNCTLCSSTGARWGYFEPGDVEVDGTTQEYHRTDKDEPAAIIHFCATCATTTHFTLTPEAAARFGGTVVGVNLRPVPDAELAGIELRYPDGRAWSGAGAFGYVREPRMLG